MYLLHVVHGGVGGGIEYDAPGGNGPFNPQTRQFFLPHFPLLFQLTSRFRQFGQQKRVERLSGSNRANDIGGLEW